MEKDILVLRSITYAYKAQHVLEKQYIRSYVIRTPEHYAPSGCSYSLAVSGKGTQAAEILRQNGIQVLKIIQNT
ncbi:MAG: DUF3343 domain-containing protein [Candidatus Merdivicinus sp.]|jgi:hypothetical protein